MHQPAAVRPRRNAARRACVATAALLAAVAGALPGAGPAVAVPPGEVTVAPAVPLAAPSGTRVAVLPGGTPAKDLVLHWSAPRGAVDGTTTYRVQLSPSADWADTPTLDATTPATRYALPLGLPHGTYWWRVRAVPGAWSVPQEVTRAWDEAPVAVDPERNEQARFAWTPVRGASAYQVQVSTEAPADPGAGRLGQAPSGVQSCWTNHTELTPYTTVVPEGGEATLGTCRLTLAVGPTYWWRVRAHDQLAGSALDVDTTPGSAAGISPLPPGTVDDRAPVDLTCPPAATGGSAPVSPTPDTASGDGADADGHCTPSKPTQASAWSAAVPFVLAPLTPATTGRPAAGPPVHDLVRANPGDCRAAADGVAECSDTPELSWDPAAGASAYRVYLAHDAAFTNVQQVYETRLRTLRPAGSLPDASAGRIWHAAVQACSADACGALTTTSFRKRSRPVSLAAPAPGAALRTGVVTLDWADWLRDGGAPAQSAAAYRVQVGRDPELDGATDALVDLPTWTAETRLADGTWHWRVQPVDGSGNRLPWSEVRSFVVDTVAPVASLAPGALRLGGPVDVRFSEPVRGATALALVAADGRTAPSSVLQGSAGARLQLGRPLVAGMPYALQVGGVTDLAGNPAVAPPRTRADGVVDNASPALARSAGWSRWAASGASGGVYDAARPARVLGAGGPRASTWVAGASAAVYGCFGPRSGVAAVYVDGRLRATVDTYRPWTGCGALVARVTGLAPGVAHRVDVVATGRRAVRSGGTTVALDGVVTR